MSQAAYKSQDLNADPHSCAAWIARFGTAGPNDAGVPTHYAVFAALLVPMWLAVMWIDGCYDYRLFGRGTDEFRKLITAAIHMLAVIAISRITWTGMSRIVTNPTRSASSAMMAGASSCLKVRRAASILSSPAKAASLTALIFCTP